MKLRSRDQLLCYASAESLNKKLTCMKVPRQWINAWLKEDPKRLDLVDCFYVCYHTRRQKAKTSYLLT